MRLADLVLSGMVGVSTAAVVLIAVWLVATIAGTGGLALSWNLLLEPPRQAGQAGGIGTVLVSTALILAIALLATLPVGLGTAVWLTGARTPGRRWSALLQRSLDVLAGVPSIVFGLFGYTFFCVFLGMGYSILAGGLTLSCMILPLFVRTTQEALRQVPRSYLESAAALGLSRTTTLRRIVLPLAAPGIAVGLVLCIARSLSETAALLFTSGLVLRMPRSLLDPGRTLSIHIYDLAMHVPGGEKNAYASALILMGLLLVINVTVSLTSSRIMQKGILAR